VEGRTRRSSRSEARRRRTRTRLTIGALVLLAVLGVVLGLGAVLDLDRGGSSGDDPVVSAPDALPDDPQPVLTVVTLADAADDDGDGSEVVGSVAVLAVERATGRGTVLLVPVTTLVEVPGHGTVQVREAYALGGSALVGASLDGLLGIRSDAAATITEAAWTDVLRGLGTGADDPATDDPATAPAQLATALAGGAVADPARLTDVGTGYLDVLDRVLEAPERLGEVFAGEGPDLTVARPGSGPPDAAEGLGGEVVHTLLAELAAARADGAVAAEALAVEAADADAPDGVFVPERVRIEAFVADRLAPSRVDQRVVDGLPVQVLDGNDVEGVIDLVAAVLEPAGYELLLTGNADRSDHAETRIVVHGDDPETLAAARDVRDRLGVGTIERAGTPLSVVELTIVVGLDFPAG
jgi:polyisoprenyl-teichoic acid--peptidoglycan teichoic acid transferase